MGDESSKKEVLQVIAEQIAQLRKAKGITQEVFYMDTNIHIGRIESENTNFRVLTFLEICDYLEISPEDFFSLISASLKNEIK